MNAEIEERVPGGGFVYVGPNKRVVWKDFGDYIEVNNHSNWGIVSNSLHKKAADELSRTYKKEVRQVNQLTGIEF